MRPFWPRIRWPISGAGRAPCACASPAPLKQIATTAQASSHTGISRSRAAVSASEPMITTFRCSRAGS